MSGVCLNAECLDILDRRVLSTVERAYQETGRRVSLIGQSLGGLLARSVAIAHPEMVVRIITLGTPFRAISVNPWVGVAASAVRFVIFLRHGRDGLPKNCYTPRCGCPTAQRLRNGHIPHSVTKLALFTRGDSVVDWRSCIYDDPSDPQLDREVHGGTHASLAFHHESFRIIAEELARCGVEERAVA
ncbi:MAG TPA: alpha/beta hydrolase-fold protein [Candidatus Nanoarchaeia archaeon]